MADWTTDAVDALEAVGLVRGKTVVRAEKASRAVVGLVVAFFVLVRVLMLAIALFRVLVVIVVTSGLLWGGIFVLAGVLLVTATRSRRT